MNKINIINDEKKQAIINKHSDYNHKYDIDKDELEKSNYKMANISNIRETRKEKLETKELVDYEKIWNEFKNKHSDDFKAYMNYGIEEIKKIGIKDFIDFMDWKSINDIPKYRTDKIKVIPCRCCKNKFTTFQLDYGLCDECKKKYDLERFEKSLKALDKTNPGMSSAMITAFTFFDDFKILYQLDLPLKEQIDICINIDCLSGEYTKNFVCKNISNKKRIKTFKKAIKNTGSQKSLSILQILNSGISNGDKIKRINEVCDLKNTRKI